MENPLTILTESIYDFFVKPNDNKNVSRNHRNISTLVRVHNGKMHDLGDVSFPCDANVWTKHFNKEKDTIDVEKFKSFNGGSDDSGNSRKEFLENSRKWPFPVMRIELKEECCKLYLQRACVIEKLLNDVLSTPSYGLLKKSKQCCVKLVENVDLEEDLSSYRAKLLQQTLGRLLAYSKWTLVDELPKSNSTKLLLLEVRSVKDLKGKAQESDESQVTVKCGIVTDPLNGGKLAQLKTSDYLSLRSNDMCLMALHKYGVRVKQDARFRALIERLGAAAVTVDLMEVKPSSPVRIIRNGQGSTKGASFILYNSARLETMLRTFEERVRNSTYGPLPSIGEANLTLLTEEEEWQLVYGYIATFPDLVERCLEQVEHGSCATHLIVRYLNGLVAVFSVYYRRIRILTERRDHLMPFVYARIYLLKAVREILNKTMALLDIDPVEYM